MDILVVPMLILVPLLFLFLKLKSSSPKLPPGATTWQVLLRVSEFQKKPHLAFANLAKLYGPIMSLRLGTQAVIIASSASVAEEILKTQDRNFSGRYLPAVCYNTPSAEHSALAMSKDCNATWKFLRGITQSSLFSSRSIESRAGRRKAKALDMVRYLRSKHGQVVELDDVVNSVVYSIVSDMLVSRELFSLAREDDESARRVVKELIEMVSSMGLSDLFPFLRMVDIRTKRKGREMYRKIVYVWGDVVKERRLERTRGGNADSSSDGDLLDVLLDNVLPDDQICLTIMEILSAGTDSSIITSVWLLAELIKNPHMLHKLCDEVAKAFEGDDHDHDGMTINESILTECKYLQACIKETLRLHIAGPFLIPHRAIETCKIGNYVIPKDSMVLVNAWAIGRDPEHWKNADVFNPDRFLDSTIDFRGSHFEFIPFSAGRRMCPGFNVAFKNIQIIVASLVHYFDWNLPDEMDLTEIDMGDVFETVLKKEKPLYLIPGLRN